jgi:hypothetical protein
LAAHKVLREILSKHPLVKSKDPAISDVMSDEVAQEMDRLLTGVEKDFGRAQKAR